MIKVEDPDVGDYMRFVPPSLGDTSYAFAMVNRNKKSVAINLKEKDGQQVLHRLVKRADIFIEQFRAGVAGKLGADPKILRRVNPRLVYCAFEGFGVTGPYAGRPAHDLDFEALAGILSVTGSEDRHPVIPGVPITDLAAAFNAAFSILAALRRRDATGKGEFVDVSIFDTAVSLMVLNFARYLGTGEIPVPGETLVTGQWAFYNAYETKDGRWLTVAAVEPKFWSRLVNLLGLSEFEGDQLADEPGRARAIAAIRSAFRTRTLEEWKTLLGKEDLPWAPVQTLPEVVKDPHVLARQMLVETDLGRLGKRKVLNHPAKIEGLSQAKTAHVPQKGEHTTEVLKSLGYTAADITRLRNRGVIGG